jgi:sugar phosphate isomerase/epimerase
MQLGISSYTFGWAVQVGGFDENDLLNCVLELGVSLVQFGDNLPLHELSDTRLDALSVRAARENIALETGARGLTARHLQRYLEISRRLNAKLLRFVADDGEYHPSAEEIIAILRAAAPQLGPVQIGLENHDRFAASALRHIVETIGSENVGICLDTANSLGAGEGLSEVLAHLAPHTLNLHIKDFAIERVPYLMGFTVEGRAAGEGMMNLPNVLAQLDAARCQTAVLELWTPPETALSDTLAKERQWAKRSLDYLRGLGCFV